MRFGSKYYFLLMYVGALVVSSLPALLKHGDNQHYTSLGASGGVAAVIFSGIVFFPGAAFLSFY
ncbi:hypothetical protein [Chitinophaga sedimenti]|uniref:hypothetical protein n=1 Tax=Chitinophaga sedimenti TaxID=2033606 RepID=UPI00249F40BC|nr:hypothetical protein [Chitinophaga sedimenti]